MSPQVEKEIEKDIAPKIYNTLYHTYCLRKFEKHNIHKLILTAYDDPLPFDLSTNIFSCIKSLPKEPPINGAFRTNYSKATSQRQKSETKKIAISFISILYQKATPERGDCHILRHEYFNWPFVRTAKRELRNKKIITYSLMFSIIALLNFGFIFLPNVVAYYLTYPFIQLFDFLKWLAQIVDYHFTSTGAMTRIIWLIVIDGFSCYWIPHELHRYGKLQKQSIQAFSKNLK